MAWGFRVSGVWDLGFQGLGFLGLGLGLGFLGFGISGLSGFREFRASGFKDSRFRVQKLRF